MKPWVRVTVAVAMATPLMWTTRAEADGEPVAGFGVDGVMIDTALNPGDEFFETQDAIDDAAGRILVLATVVSPDNLPIGRPGVLLRYLPDGSRDPSFGSNGVVDLPAGSLVTESRIAVEAKGTILVTANPLMRFSADGRTVTALAPTHFFVGGVATRDGSIALVESGNITQIRPTGGLDTGYNGDLAAAFPGRGLRAAEAAALGDSLVVLANSPPPPGVLQSECNLVKLDAEGTPDLAFGTAGVVHFPGTAFCHLDATSDGRLIMSSQPDQTATTTLLSATGQFIAHLSFADNSALVVGNSPDRFVYVDFGTATISAAKADGTVDSTFNLGNPIPMPDYRPNGLRVMRNGNIVVWGSARHLPVTIDHFVGDVALQLISTSFAPPPQVVAVDTDKFVPVPPKRILDTREGLGAPLAKLGTGGQIDLQIAGAGGVPATGVSAVVLNVTATNATQAGFVTVFPSGRRLPLASNLNLERAGQTAANLVTVKVGTNGKVTLFSSGGTDLVADVAGYYIAAVTATDGRLQTAVPQRILDTRVGLGAPQAKLAAGGHIDLQVTGRGPVPASGVEAVVLNVTGDQASTGGFVTVWPAGTDRPVVSNLNLVTGETRANLVVVPVGIGGMVSLFSSGGTELIADVAGWFTDASAAQSSAGLFVPIAPSRMLDTRDLIFTTQPRAPGSSLNLHVASTAIVPAASSIAVAVNITSTDSSGAGFVTAWPANADRPVVSNLNITHVGQTIPNAAIVPLGLDQLDLFTQTGANLIVDVNGWYTNS